MATAWSAVKASSRPAWTSSAIRAGSSTRRTETPIRLIEAATDRPIGTCQGLNSPHSPRIVTSVSNGKRQFSIRLSMLMQLPTPLDCISSTERCPPSHAPQLAAMPSSSVVSG